MALRRSIIAHHLVLTLYGHWAPNDPRGSGSTALHSAKFAPLGPIHFGRKPAREQPSRQALRAFHREFTPLLNHPVIWIDEAKRQAFGAAIGDVVHRAGYTAYECAICSNHVHLIVRIHRDDALAMCAKFMEGARSRLRSGEFEDVAADHPVWAERPYKVFLYTPEDVRSRIDYVNANPEKEGLPRQVWSFVSPYNNWPHHKVNAPAR